MKKRIVLITAFLLSAPSFGDDPLMSVYRGDLAAAGGRVGEADLRQFVEDNFSILAQNQAGFLASIVELNVDETNQFQALNVQDALDAAGNFNSDEISQVVAQLDSATLQRMFDGLSPNTRNQIESAGGTIPSASPERPTWEFFRFDTTADNNDPANRDPLIGGISLGKTENTQNIALTAFQYNLQLGSNEAWHLPFQVIVGNEVGDSNNGDEESKANAQKILNADNGLAIRFPFLWRWNPKSIGFCNFDSGSIGSCSLGFDVTMNFKELENDAGDTETAFGQTFRLGASLKFPIIPIGIDSSNSSFDPYLAIGTRLIYATTDIDDPAQLFTPVMDTAGNVVKFDDSIHAGEIEIKWAFTESLGVSLKYLKPYNNKEYIDEQFSVSFVTQF